MRFFGPPFLPVFGVASLLCAGLHAQTVPINTLSGYSGRGSTDGASANGRFFQPAATAVDAAGNIYVADTGNHIVRKVAPNGIVTTIAGLAGVSGNTDAVGKNARFNQPSGIAVDGSGNLYVGDFGNHTVRKITPGGSVTTLAGLAGVSGTNNGTGTAARFFEPSGLALDGATNVYVADYGNHTIRKITPAGVVTTFAGSPTNPGTNNGTGSAQFYFPQSVAIDGGGTLYVADSANHTVRKITSGGSVSTLAGSPGNYGTNDGTGSAALFYQPAGVAVDGLGNVYVADSLNHAIRKITSGGTVSTVAGSQGNSGSVDGVNNAALFRGPSGIAFGVFGLVVADSGNGTIRDVAASGPNWITTTLAGSPSIGSADGTGAGSRFSFPAAIAADNNGNFYIADAQNNTIRKMTSDGTISTLAGQAGVVGSVDGSGTNALFNQPQGIAVDGAGATIYVGDTGNGTIRKVTASGTVTTMAGLAGDFGVADGAAINARFYRPQGLAVDGSGTVYVADTWSHTLRKITFGGFVTTLAGLAGSFGSTDGTNSAARFNWPAGVALGNDGNLYVTDYRNHSLRRVTPAGLVSTLAGLPGVSGSVDGTNSVAHFCRPLGVVVDATGNVYVTDSGNQTVRKVSPSGPNWAVTTLAGLPGISGASDGNVSAFFNPSGIAVDGAGYLYVGDAGNNSIRVDKIQPPPLTFSYAASQAILSWPISAPGFIVEATTLLNPPVSWTQLADPIVQEGPNYITTNLSAATAAFYRLHRP